MYCIYIYSTIHILCEHVHQTILQVFTFQGLPPCTIRWSGSSVQVPSAREKHDSSELKGSKKSVGDADLYQ